MNDVQSDSSSDSKSTFNVILQANGDHLSPYSNNMSHDPDYVNVMPIGTRSTKRLRPISSDTEDEPTNANENETIWNRRKVVEEQWKDEDTKTIIECVEMGKKPLHHEIRQESPYMNSIMDHFETLTIVNGELRKSTLGSDGKILSLLVVPESAARKLIFSFHVTMAHSNCWRLQKHLANIYFIPRLNFLLRDVYKTCEQCLLSAPPTAQRARKITVSDSIPTRELSVDLLHLAPSGGFKYVLIACDIATSYVFARKLKSKSSKETAEALLDIFYSNSFLCQSVSTDFGTEFENEFNKIINQCAALHISNHVMIKNSIKAESMNFRVTNLLRRMLTNEKQWPQVLQKCIFSLNCSSMNYNGFITTPSQLFNNRCLTGVPCIDDDVEKSVITSGKTIRELMTQVSNYRRTDTPSLSQNVNSRVRPFRKNEQCLIWREHFFQKC